MKTVKIQTLGPKTYSINTVPVTIIETDLPYREYDVDYRLDTSVKIGGKIYLVCSDHIDETEGEPTVREFKVPKQGVDGIPCEITNDYMECPGFHCADCIYYYLATL